MKAKLIIPKVCATVQMPTVQIPFKIVCEEIDRRPNLLITFLNWRWWSWQKIMAMWKARGIIRFYDKAHGEIDHKNFVDVELTAQLVWARHFKRILELSGTLPNVGRFCFTGWGECFMEVYNGPDNHSLFRVSGDVETEIVERIR
jgi:hypothetical protein